jgi:iron complex outermembrane recepter protein
MKKTICYFILLLLSLRCVAQDEPDSLETLTGVTVRAFEQPRSLLSSIVPVRILDVLTDKHFNRASLVGGLNSISGVRMEERSPGSYRINIRGSSLRSPFGVRNIKVYWNDIPISDPGGNTYFNQFAWNNFSYLELFKGPAGSMYGAGTGGLILLNNFERWRAGASLDYTGGSYGLHNIMASARFGQQDNKHQITYAHGEADGYRVQTRMRRDNFSWISQLKTSERNQFTASILFSDLYYQTPGALTLTEFNNNPKAARPAGGGFPSAVDAKAAIFQKNVLAGLSNQYAISPVLKNTLTLYGAFAQVKNSAIRNYERRNEPHFGGRTLFSYTKTKQETTWQLIAGGEFQQGYFNTQVARNRNGNPDTLQTNDDVNNTAWNLFAQADVSIQKKWFIAGGISLNKSKVAISRLNVYPVTKQVRTYRNEFSPRLSIMRKFGEQFSWLATVSKGFSPPTVAEVLPSTGVISTELEAEQGWNYETTFRANLLRRRLNIELTGFYFKLNNALVQRRDLSGADFFINAGDIDQKGIEFHSDYLHDFRGNVIDYIMLNADLALNRFRYGSFIKGTDNFSGKKVPSVPSATVAILADLAFKNGIYINPSYYSASRIYLNDANTATAEPYHLVGCQLGWKKNLKKHRVNIFAGADNLLDEQYSLGNDINAAAGRYYNAAPRRNYYVGASLQWLAK